MTNIKKIYEFCFIILLLVLILASLFFALFRPINILFNPERFVCSRQKDSCIYINSKQDRVYDLSKIQSASCQKIYHPGIKTGHFETWLNIETGSDISNNEVIYRTGFCENQANKLNSFLNSVEDEFEIKQIVDSFQISISLYILVFALFIGSFFKIYLLK